MIDRMREVFTAIQAWIFEAAVQPVMFSLGLMAYAEDAYEGLGMAMVGVIEIAVLVALFKPLEAWRPVEQWAEKRAVRTDVIYTWLNRLGVLPLAIFLLLVIPVNELEIWLRMHGIVRPNIEDVMPWIERNSIGAFLIYLLLLDFVEYWVHRGQHQLNWWWALHSLHHSQRQMTFWADDRNHLLDDVITSAAVAVAALIIGVPSGQFFLIIIAGRMIESLSHANARVSFGWLGERLLVSPKFHRAHHAIGVGHEGAYRGCNFAVLFPLWDIVFRTANFQSAYEPTGIRDQLQGRDYGIGFWRQQWLGLVRLKASFRGAS
ncbi:MAG: sterol desaturase family protein [Betaproteobacteria bacterium]|nr:sterol desaturase family protein [Betaproteobacteria bacterium]